MGGPRWGSRRSPWRWCVVRAASVGRLPARDTLPSIPKMRTRALGPQASSAFASGKRHRAHVLLLPLSQRRSQLFCHPHPRLSKRPRTHQSCFDCFFIQHTLPSSTPLEDVCCLVGQRTDRCVACSFAMTPRLLLAATRANETHAVPSELCQTVFARRSRGIDWYSVAV
jgi:hypothetical protein